MTTTPLTPDPEADVTTDGLSISVYGLRPEDLDCRELAIRVSIVDAPHTTPAASVPVRLSTQQVEDLVPQILNGGSRRRHV